eukprot:6118-Heterococcus_DN1.PRE.7
MQQLHGTSSSAFAFPHQQQQHVSARTTELLSDAITQLQSTLAIAAAIMPKVRTMTLKCVNCTVSDSCTREPQQITAVAADRRLRVAGEQILHDINIVKQCIQQYSVPAAQRFDVLLDACKLLALSQRQVDSLYDAIDQQHQDNTAALLHSSCSNRLLSERITYQYDAITPLCQSLDRRGRDSLYTNDRYAGKCWYRAHTALNSASTAKQTCYSKHRCNRQTVAAAAIVLTAATTAVMIASV